MERKIGEIFEYDGEWYQCIVGGSCENCAFDKRKCYTFAIDNDPIGECRGDRRKDGKYVLFKKLEKVGEPYMLEDKKFQKYRVFKTPYIYHKIDYSWQSFAGPYYISLEIKEDMEERKLIELLSEKVHNAWMKEKEAQGFSYGKDYDKEKKKHPDMLPYNKLKEEVKEYDRATVRAVLQAQKELQGKYNYNNLKSFDIEAAKAGKPVCTRDGRKARTICFDRIDAKPILALVRLTDGKGEDVFDYFVSGKRLANALESDLDLMMLPEKKEGWVNIDKGGSGKITISSPYSTKEEAIHNDNETTIDTIKISWEE